MKITDLRIKRFNGAKDSKLKAYFDISFDEELVIHGVKLIEGDSGLFVAMPSRKMADNEYRDIVHPISTKLREHITKALIECYNNTAEDQEVFEVDKAE